MSFEFSTRRTHRAQLPRWSSAAFIVEALVLLVFLAAAAAIFVQLFAQAAEQSAQSAELSRAVAVASDTAERFAADPSSVGDFETEDGLFVRCTAYVENRAAGDFSHATISVYRVEDSIAGDEDDALYTIETAHYEPKEASWTAS